MAPPMMQNPMQLVMQMMGGLTGGGQPGPTTLHAAFQLPPPPAEELTRLSGALMVAGQSVEHVFTFFELDTPDQTLTEGDVDVTLQAATPTDDGGYQVQLTISRPTRPGDEALGAGGIGGFGGFGGLMGNFGGLDNLPPQMRERILRAMGQAGVEVQLEVNADGGAPAPAPGAGPQQPDRPGRRMRVERGPGNMLMRLLGGPTLPVTSGLMPLVALQGAEQRVLAGPPQTSELNRTDGPDGRLTVSYTLTLPAVDEPVELQVALIEVGGEPTTVPFALTAVALPPGA